MPSTPASRLGLKRCGEWESSQIDHEVRVGLDSFLTGMMVDSLAGPVDGCAVDSSGLAAHLLWFLGGTSFFDVGMHPQLSIKVTWPP